jgi:BirA family transcriptional regulator, biotin operon repressor / biotin---[acetyl-CoA-carboxylase] ligase
MNTWSQEQLADKILTHVREKGTAVPLTSLVKKFGIEQSRVEEALKDIRSWGYRLKKRKGTVLFRLAPDVLTPTEIDYHRKSKIMATKAYCFSKVKSTNDVASQLAEQGAVEGTVVTAEHQTKGRGRFGRNWFSPTSSGIYVSIILRPTLPQEKAPGLSIVTSLALADTLAKYCPGEIYIKWPNDILLAGKKVAGILTELSSDQNSISHVIVGVGINVNQKAGEFPDNIGKHAISLRAVTKRKINRAEILREFLYRFEKEYAKFLKAGLASSRKRVRKLSHTIGKQVKLASGAHVIEGKAIDIDSNGALVLDQNGSRICVSAGEVTVVKE